MTRHHKSTEQQIVESILRGIGWVLRLPFQRWLARSRQPTISRTEVESRWQTIADLVKSDNSHNLSQAIILADKLLDAVLQAKGTQGETMGERLKAAHNVYANQSVYQGAWDGHKLRNQIAHEVSHEVDINEARAAVEKLKQAIFNLV